MAPMWYCGPIRCPNCDLPISDDVSVCPYCHSTAPMRAPWNRGRWWPFLAVGLALAAIWLYDQVAGTGYAASVIQYFQKGPR